MACVGCGQLDKRLPSDYKYGLERRCRPCARQESRRLRDLGISPKTDIECCACKKTITLYKFQALRQKNVPCSEECRRVMWTRRPKGPDHPQYKGQPNVYYGADWRKQSAAARVRDGNVCRECGVTRAAYGREFDVHHIVRFLNFATSTEANVLSNLITLCRTCHRRADVVQHNELKAAGVELNGQRRSRRKTYPLFKLMADVVRLFVRHWNDVGPGVEREGENFGGVMAALYAINYGGSVRRSRGLSVTPDRGQVTSYRRFTSEIENDCWRFTLDGYDSPDPRPWAELLASGDHKRIVAAERTHYLDWEKANARNHIITNTGRSGNLPATKRRWRVSNG